MKYTHFDADGKFVNFVEWDGETEFHFVGRLVPFEPEHDLLAAPAAEVPVRRGWRERFRLR